MAVRADRVLNRLLRVEGRWRLQRALVAGLAPVAALVILLPAAAQESLPTPPPILSEAPLRLQGALDAASAFLTTEERAARVRGARDAEFAQRQQLPGARDRYLAAGRDAASKTRAAVSAARGFGEKLLDVPATVGQPAWNAIAAARALALSRSDDVAMDTLRALLQVPQRCAPELQLARTKAALGTAHTVNASCTLEAVRRDALAEVDRVEAGLSGAAPVAIPAAAAPQGMKTISGGMLNAKATTLPVPVYPAAAKASRAEGTVIVTVSVDENGKVSAASALSGHPLLRQAAEEAARKARFAPAQAGGSPVKVTGMLSFSFELQPKSK